MNEKLAALFKGPWPAVVWNSVMYDKDGLRHAFTYQDDHKNANKRVLRLMKRYLRNRLIMKQKECRRKHLPAPRMKEFLATFRFPDSWTGTPSQQ